MMNSPQKVETGEGSKTQEANRLTITNTTYKTTASVKEGNLGQFVKDRTLTFNIGPLTKERSELNFVLLGDFGVGKTAFAVRFVTGRYLHEYDPYLERTYERLIEYNDSTVVVKLWDTVTTTWSSYVGIADAFIILYSVTSYQSASNALKIAGAVRRASAKMPLLVVGNKAEMERARRVKNEEMAQHCDENGFLFEETSVATCEPNRLDRTVRKLVKRVQTSENNKLLQISQSLIVPSIVVTNGDAKDMKMNKKQKLRRFFNNSSNSS